MIEIGNAPGVSAAIPASRGTRVIGLADGDVVYAHVAMGRLGWICGDAQTVIPTRAAVDAIVAWRRDNGIWG